MFLLYQKLAICWGIDKPCTLWYSLPRMKTYKTLGRLRAKFGSKLIDVKVPVNLKRYDRGLGFEFVSKIENLPKELFDRFSMIYVKT